VDEHRKIVYSGEIRDLPFCEELLYRCSKIRELIIPSYAAHNAEMISRMLDPCYCQDLEWLTIECLAADQAQYLVKFLERRRSGDYTCATLYLHIGRLEGQVLDDVIDSIKMAVEYLTISGAVVIRWPDEFQEKTIISPGAFSYAELGIPPWDDTFYLLDVEFPHSVC
jgi:hypothetical protein